MTTGTPARARRVPIGRILKLRRRLDVVKGYGAVTPPAPSSDTQGDRT
ncbi:MAG: hypothetical protein OXG81_14835 [Acidobacteria bacterium]|nr:hypothetical protein [Acidobacteriota bacterium]